MNSSLKIYGGYRRYLEVSYLRGIAIIALVIMHMIQNYDVGVPLVLVRASSRLGVAGHYFFLCSGFGLYLSYLRKNKDHIAFISGRFLRVYIPYIIVVTLCYICPLCVVDGNRTLAFFSHVFLFKMFVAKYLVSFGTQFWFISTLFQLYFLFIPLCNLKRKLGNKCFLIASLFTSIIWGMIMYCLNLIDVRVVGSCFIRYLWEFSLGIVLADYLIDKKEITISNWSLTRWAIASTFITILLYFGGGFLSVFNDITGLISFVCMGLLLYEIGFLNKIMVMVGNMSLEIYLLHIVTMTIMFYFYTPNRLDYMVLYRVFVLIVVIGIAYIFKLVILASLKCTHLLLGGTDK